MIQPLISIIIPVYNGSNFLKESINSALSQTYNNIEVIVINDGSSDKGETEKIALSYKNKIRYYSKKNGGVSSALNYGINKMNGEWFSWLSHDDLYHPDKIKDQIEVLLNACGKKVIIMTNGKLIDKNGISIKHYAKKNNKKRYDYNEMFEKLYNHCSINGCSLLIPKDALVEAGYFDENLKYVQDWKMWIMLTLENYSFICINKILVKTRIHEKQQTVKIKDLGPIESHMVTIEILSELAKDVSINKKRITTIMYWGIRNGNIEIINKCLDLLNESNNYKPLDAIKYNTYYVIGTLSGKIKKELKKHLNNIRRRN